MSFIVRWLVTAIAVAAAIWIVPGISVAATTDTLVAVGVLAFVLSLLNVSIKPIMQFLGTPLTLLTLGIFSIVINALVLMLAGWLSNGMFGIGIYINSFGSAFFAAIVISIVSAIVNSVAGLDE
ncbi:Membrane protein of uncharacterised function [Slackia heliotrinireducens]|uniref:Predicted membrane protein n=1 Tax=Slackia heliotrinireducens (strain ATCC 29202 / DSM 20476 / NCTC 11029 / RHS 1) TaxID=471855 RepID=C7N353_SLAHD|nr:phage holin family protein [Slackia heliotrinireducens]ACV21574.1 predicted membrane protein [Slackia heliotrinireducens DSM 20476]VEG99088.1 Membrane protein of uncharacterised function [Slackia heliotrinireducens]